MHKSKNPNTWRKTLIYKHAKTNRETIRRAYRQWRTQEELPMRCDNPECKFHKEELIWNGKVLSLILDHENGNNLDNRPNNLRYLCPNCDSQLHTRGGGNIGRVRAKWENGFMAANLKRTFLPSMQLLVFQRRSIAQWKAKGRAMVFRYTPKGQPLTQDKGRGHYRGIRP